MNTPRLHVAPALAAAIALAGIIGILSILFGAEYVPLRRLMENFGDTGSSLWNIVWQQRVPRTLAALLAGGGLALAGCAFQAALRNPLATPYTLGVSSAAALGAWCAGLARDAFHLHAVPGVEQAFAFSFAIADVALIYAFTRRQVHASPSVLLLAGVTLGMLANSGIMLTRYFAQPERLVSMDRWLLGGVDVLGFSPILLLCGVLPCAFVLCLQSNKLDQYCFSPELAEGRGVSVSQLLWVVFFFGSLLTAVIVSVTGPIAFIGLVVPHFVRMITGPRHVALMPVAFVAGGAFLCGCDLLSRLVMPGETPAGIITTLVGAPLFLHILLRGRKGAWN
jgi:iron complex transport system permease protein